MTLDEIVAEMRRGCCSEHRVAVEGCAQCGSRYAAIEAVRKMADDLDALRRNAIAERARVEGLVFGRPLFDFAPVARVLDRSLRASMEHAWDLLGPGPGAGMFLGVDLAAPARPSEVTFIVDDLVGDPFVALDWAAAKRALRPPPPRPSPRARERLTMIAILSALGRP